MKIKKGLIICLLICLMYILINITPKFLDFMETQKDILNILPQSQVFKIEESKIEIKNINTSQNILLPSDIAEKMRKNQEEKARKEIEIAKKERLSKQQIKQEQTKKQEIAKQTQQKKSSQVTSRSTSSRTSNNSGYMQFTATGYCPCSKCCGKTNGVTSSGVKAKAGVTVAMPSKYAFGTQIEIKGMGIYTVQDRGGAIKGNKVDIFFNTHQEALNFGRRTVYIKIL